MRIRVAVAVLLVAILAAALSVALQETEVPDGAGLGPSGAGSEVAGPSTGMPDLRSDRAGDSLTTTAGLETPLTRGGLLVSREETPIAGARVRYVGDPRHRAETFTDREGKYAIPVPWRQPRGSGLRIEKEGFLSDIRTFVTPRETVITFLEKIRARLTARVVDLDGNAIAGASVKIEDEEPPFVSGADGVVGPFPVGEFDVDWWAWSLEHPLTRGDWDLEAGEDLVVTLPPAAFVRGVAVTEDGVPVAGAEVFAASHPALLRIRTGVDGTFRFPLPIGWTANLDVLTSTLFGRADVYAGAPVRVVLGPGGLRIPGSAPMPPPDPRPEVAGKVTVRIVDQDGGVPRGAGIRIKSESPPWHASQSARGGTCTIEIPADARVTVRVGCTNAEPYETEVTVAEGQTRDLGTIVLRPVRPPPRPPKPEPPPPAFPGAIRGRVVDAEGRPVHDVTVEPLTGRAYDSTDIRGRFVLDGGFDEEVVWLGLSVDGYPPITAAARVNAPEMTIRLPARGAIRIRLARPAPLDRGEVDFAVWTSRSLDDAFLDVGDTPFFLDEGDSVRIDCPAGIYQVAFAMDPGEWMFCPDVEVFGGRETVLHYGFPATAGRLRGTVRGADGSPVRNAKVTVAWTGGSIGRTDEEGRLDEEMGSHSLLPAGVFRLRVLAKGFAPALTRPIDLTKKEEFEIRLARGGEVRGILVDHAGAPIDGQVSLLPEIGPPLLSAYSDEEGFVLEGRVAAGVARLRAEVDGRDPVETAVVVCEGEVAEVKIVVP